MGGGNSTAKVGVVHDVVVIQSREVDEFDDLCGEQNVGAVRVAQFGGQQCQQGTNPLAPGFEKITSDGVRVLIAEMQVVSKTRFDCLQSFVEPLD